MVYDNNEPLYVKDQDYALILRKVQESMLYLDFKTTSPKREQLGKIIDSFCCYINDYLHILIVNNVGATFEIPLFECKDSRIFKKEINDVIAMRKAAEMLFSNDPQLVMVVLGDKRLEPFIRKDEVLKPDERFVVDCIERICNSVSEGKTGKISFHFNPNKMPGQLLS